MYRVGMPVCFPDTYGAAVHQCGMAVHTPVMCLPDYHMSAQHASVPSVSQHHHHQVAWRYLLAYLPFSITYMLQHGQGWLYIYEVPAS